MANLVLCFVSNKGYPTTQFDMDAVEAIGLIKIDILAQGDLAVMRDSTAALTRRGIAVDFDRLEPWQDTQVWEMIASGGGRAVHHIESPAMIAAQARQRIAGTAGASVANTELIPCCACKSTGSMQPAKQTVADQPCLIEQRGTGPARRRPMITYHKWSDVPATLKTKTGWSQAGRSVCGNPTAEILTYYPRHGTHRYDLYDEAVTCPKRKVVDRPAVVVDLLAAIWAVSRSAKRYRNGVESAYLNRAHGMAGRCRETKEWLYELKDGGIAAAAASGRIHCDGKHGDFAVWRGEGYCFHSFLWPVGVVLPELPWAGKTDGDGTNPFVEVKPRVSREPRLKDAVHTLEDLPNPGPEFKRRESAKPREKRPKIWQPETDDDDYDDWGAR